MSEQQEDLNAFNSWDCFGATLMLGIVPGVIHYATTDPHDEMGAALMCVVGVIISVVVLAIALITRWRIIGTIVNWAGGAITIMFIIYMTLFWVESCSESAEKALPDPATAAPAAHP